MNKKILPVIAVSALLGSSGSFAQKNSAFAVTGQSKGNFNWNTIREVDLSTGEVIRTIYDPAAKKSVNYTSASAEPLNSTVNLNSPASQSIAAAAFDAAHNRVYFNVMKSNELSYVDLTASELNVVVKNNPAFNTGNKADEANVITRMTFASDGTGYALTNDGKNLIRFTTGQKATVSNLGSLIDGKKNGTVSVHTQCNGWGGDMVGDAFGNLYLVTYRNMIYKINPQTRITDFVGQVKGLPADFTTNGVVVNNDGDLVVSSALLSNNYYRVNISTLDAEAINKKEDKVFNSSDLANGNLLYDSKIQLKKFPFDEVKGNEAVSIFPNPASNKTFNVQFEKVPAGKYNLVLSDAAGRNVISKTLVIAQHGQLEKVLLPKTAAAGLYLVRLTGGDSKVVYSDKIIIQ